MHSNCFCTWEASETRAFSVAGWMKQPDWLQETCSDSNSFLSGEAIAVHVPNDAMILCAWFHVVTVLSWAPKALGMSLAVTPTPLHLKPLGKI